MNYNLLQRLVYFFYSGLLFDFTLHYPNSFYLGGAVSIGAALVMVPVAIFSKSEKDRPESNFVEKQVAQVGTLGMIPAALNSKTEKR